VADLLEALRAYQSDGDVGLKKELHALDARRKGNAASQCGGAGMRVAGSVQFPSCGAP
jgi:hypothetical protein